MNKIRFDNVSKAYSGGKMALSDVSLELVEGEVTFLTGHSGAGKSSFLKLIMRDQLASSGRITVNGVDLASIKERNLPYYRRGLGVVFQDHHLLMDRTVFENVAVPLSLIGLSDKVTARRVRAALTIVGLEGLSKSKPVELSAGERQRVGIARAVVMRPRVLLADEPTGNLDPELSLRAMELFAQFTEIGSIVVIASHDLPLINQIEARVVELKEGLVIDDSRQ
jgi:cell division transport system ATP-binding protein